MEVVSIMFYWGGKILRNRDEGVSYDIEPQGLYNVHRGITLAELQAMMVPKVGTHGEIMRLEFKCRLPCRGKYRLLPIKDNETLSNLLELPRKLGPDYFLEIYVEKESNFCGTEMPIPVGGTFTQMLTQSQSPDNTLIQSAHMFPEDYPPFNHSQSYNQLNASQNVDGYYSVGAGPSAPTTYNPMVLTTPYPHWNEEGPPVCNVQRTPETAVQNYAYSDDTVPLFDEVGVSDEDSVSDLDGAWEGADNESDDNKVGGHHDMQEVMKEEHSQLSHEAHECSDSILEMNKMVFAVQSLVAQCEDLKFKYSEEQRKRRKLYNEVQEAKGKIRVFCRCRPLSKAEVTAGHETVVDFDAANDGELGILSGGSTKKTIKFDRASWFRSLMKMAAQ